jgi:hypothetical protein
MQYLVSQLEIVFVFIRNVHSRQWMFPWHWLSELTAPQSTNHALLPDPYLLFPPS